MGGKDDNQEMKVTQNPQKVAPNCARCTPIRHVLWLGARNSKIQNNLMLNGSFSLSYLTIDDVAYQLKNVKFEKRNDRHFVLL